VRNPNRFTDGNNVLLRYLRFMAEGRVENANGRIRRRLPRNTNLNDVTTTKHLDPTSFVFIDESGEDGSTTRALPPCFGSVSHGHWGNLTFITKLRNDRIIATMAIPGAMDGDAFAVWTQKMLAPSLGKGDVVICDNLNVHKSVSTRKAIEAREAELRFLLAYSPDLNPIKMLFAKIKAPVRSAAARCFDTVCTAIANALDTVSAKECANYLRHAGYEPT